MLANESVANDKIEGFVDSMKDMTTKDKIDKLFPT
jgi:hypothetical protein